MQDWLRCPVCKALFYVDGMEIREEDYTSAKKSTEKGAKEKGGTSEKPTLMKR